MHLAQLLSELVHYLMLSKYIIPKTESVSVHKAGQKLSQVAPSITPPPPKKNCDKIRLAKI